MGSQYTMKVFLFGILLALGACVNGKPAPAEPADIGVVDCDALEIVMRDLVSLNKEAKEKPKMRQEDEEEEDPKKVEEMLKESLDSLPPSTNANVKALLKELGPLFKLAQTGGLTDYDLKKLFADTVKAAGLNTEDAMEGLEEQCPNLFDDKDNEGEDNEGEDNEGEDYDEDEPKDYNDDDEYDEDEDEDEPGDGKGNQ